jgi:hypothetical protein
MKTQGVLVYLPMCILKERPVPKIGFVRVKNPYVKSSRKSSLFKEDN